MNSLFEDLLESAQEEMRQKYNQLRRWAQPDSTDYMDRYKYGPGLEQRNYLPPEVAYERHGKKNSGRPYPRKRVQDWIEEDAEFASSLFKDIRTERHGAEAYTPRQEQDIWDAVVKEVMSLEKNKTRLQRHPRYVDKAILGRDKTLRELMYGEY
jgi:hypothetical protein